MALVLSLTVMGLERAGWLCLGCRVRGEGRRSLESERPRPLAVSRANHHCRVYYEFLSHCPGPFSVPLLYTEVSLSFPTRHWQGRGRAMAWW